MDLWRLGPDVSVESSSPPVCGALEVVFGALKIEGPRAPHHLQLDYREQRIIANEFPVVQVGSPDQFAPILESILTHFVAEMTRSLVGLHAGAVELDGRVVLLPGERGSGKSTASLWLSGKGGTYLADDLCFVDASGLSITGLPKAATLKSGSFRLFPESRTFADPARGNIRYHLPARHTADRKTIHRIVFPQYVPDLETWTTRLDRPIAALALVQQSFGDDARRLELAQKLSALPCHVIHYSDLASLEQKILKLP